MHQFIKQTFLMAGLLLAINLHAQEEEGSGEGPLQEAARAMNQRNYSHAEEIYRKLVDENKDDLTLQQLLCHALMNQKEFRECDSMLRRMVEKDSNNAGNYWYMGLSSERQRKDSLAACWFKYFILKSTTVNGKNVKAWLHVGSAYRRMMHDSGITRDQCLVMIRHYAEYIRLNPADPYAGEIQTFIDEVNLRKPEGDERLKWDEGS